MAANFAINITFTTCLTTRTRFLMGDQLGWAELSTTAKIPLLFSCSFACDCSLPLLNFCFCFVLSFRLDNSVTLKQQTAKLSSSTLIQWIFFPGCHYRQVEQICIFSKVMQEQASYVNCPSSPYMLCYGEQVITGSFFGSHHPHLDTEAAVGDVFFSGLPYNSSFICL